uniref:Uncharacterized protein LOC114328391 n=1 Tax=Diabrotica virgifera virgifera TaxID=50390 RepID=A0A6P7FII4_DIAVI
MDKWLNFWILVSVAPEGETIFEGDIEDFSNLEVLSPPTVFKKILRKTSSSARASGSCEDSAPPIKKSKKQEKTEAHRLISEAVTSLKKLRADYRIEFDDLPNLSANMTLAQWVGKEMDLIDDAEILNDLQESISQSLFRAKRKLFQNKRSD